MLASEMGNTPGHNCGNKMSLSSSYDGVVYRLRDKTTSDIRACVFKGTVYALSIGVGLLVGVESSRASALYVAFYLTVLIQAFNNFYDASTYLDSNLFSFGCIIRSVLVMAAAVLAAAAALCYLAGQDGGFLRNHLSRREAVIIASGLLCTTLLMLGYEGVHHLAEIHNSQNPGESYHHYYGHDSKDEMDAWKDI